MWLRGGTANPRTLTINVPAGTYSVVAKALFTNDAAAAVNASCSLTPMDNLTSGDYNGATAPASGWAAISNVGTKTFAAPGTFTYVCSNFPNGTAGSYQYASVIATKVGARTRNLAEWGA